MKKDTRERQGHRLYGGIEAGGSKFVCAVSTSPAEAPLAILRVPTTSPRETLSEVVDFFIDHDLKSLGVASFGPVDLRSRSPTYGYIMDTPKKGWKDTDLVGALKGRLRVPVGFDTDVNASVLAESLYGAAQGMSDVVYLTVGTGIGGGALVNGGVIHGLVHPEMGHVPVTRHPADSFAGRCPFHGDCLEGMASGPAIEERWSKPPGSIQQGHRAWDMEAFYLAQGVRTIMLMLSPERIVLGGGVMKNRSLFPMIRERVIEMLHGYLNHESIAGEKIDEYIVPPSLGDRSGLVGAMELARRAVVR